MADETEADEPQPMAHPGGVDVPLILAVTDLITSDPCPRRCLHGKAAALENFVRSFGAMNTQERKVSILTALSIMHSAIQCRPDRTRSTGVRVRVRYFVPFVGQVCKSSFLRCFNISAPTLSRYKRLIRSGHLLPRSRRRISERTTQSP